MDAKIFDALTLECLESIAQMQEASGAFLSTSRSLHSDAPDRVYTNPFFTGLIVHALSAVPARYSALSHIQKRACNFLLSQQSECHSFNYWHRRSDMAREFPYPDDLDDTFCILSAITRAQSELCNGTVLAHITRLLIASEISPGGPYRTWLSQKASTPPEELLPDIAVNANVAYFLKLHGLQIEPLSTFLHTQMESGALASRYYPSVWPVLYFLARSVPHASHELLARTIAKESVRLDAAPDLLFCALRLSALVSIGAPAELVVSARASVVSLAETGWGSSPFCFDPVMHGAQYLAQSEALTRALVLESLWLSNTPSNQILRCELSKQAVLAMPDFHTTVHSMVTQRIQSLPNQISDRALEAYTALMRQDGNHQIALLPMWFAQRSVTLRTPLGDAGVALGVASVFGWIAYTIYDIIMDTSESPHLLPVANMLLLELSSIYCDVLKFAPEGLSLFKKIMARMEAGNVWELLNARIPVVHGVCTLPNRVVAFSPLQPAEKSIGYALAPLIFSFIQNADGARFDETTILRFFEHYLTARQLNDDAHDWFEDASRGHLTKVNYMVLRNCSRNGSVDLSSQKLALQRYFWNTVLPHVAQTITFHILEARKALRALHLPESHRIEAILLDPLDRTAHTALADSSNAALFLKEYKNPQGAASGLVLFN